MDPALASDDFGGPDATPQSMPRSGRLFLLPPDDIIRSVIQSTSSRWDAYSARPGYGITPERVWSIFRQAEQGAPRQQGDLFEDIAENDGHLTGLINNRIETLSGKDFVVRPGDTKNDRLRVAAARLQIALEHCNVHEFIEHQLMVFWYGYAGSEPVWSFVDGWWVPVWFVNMPAQRFVFDEFNTIRLTSDKNPWPGDELRPSWMVSRGRHRITVRAGAGRCATWWSVFKRMSVRDWIVFAEKFGIPIPMGVWSERGASEVSRAVVEQAVIDIGEAGQAVMSDACKIIFADLPMRSGDASSLHPSVVARCNAEMSKLITGATLTSESGGPGSFALGKVHENRGINLERADAKRLARTFHRTIGKTFNDLNGLSGLPSPYLWIKVMPDPGALLIRAQEASILANELGMELEDDDLRYEHDYRAPVSPASAVRGTKTKPDENPQPAP